MWGFQKGSKGVGYRDCGTFQYVWKDYISEGIEGIPYKFQAVSGEFQRRFWPFLRTSGEYHKSFTSLRGLQVVLGVIVRGI